MYYLIESFGKVKGNQISLNHLIILLYKVSNSPFQTFFSHKKYNKAIMTKSVLFQVLSFSDHGLQDILEINQVPMPLILCTE